MLFYLGNIKLMAYLIGGGLILAEMLPIVLERISTSSRSDYRD